jgi:2'-hydroxyisoflavone reductase
MTPPLSRRSLLGASLALPFSAPAWSRRRQDPASSSGGKTLLVLGGTRFLGPAVVEAALARGFEVTLFNRGQSNPDLFPELESLRGDRDTGDLSALEGRSWDVVVDTSCYLPSHALQMAELLGDGVGHYVVVSTASVYEHGSEPVQTEESPVVEVEPAEVDKVTRIAEALRVEGGRLYGPLKALCEVVLEETLPGRVTSLRPGVIAGRDDPSDRLPYWVARIAQGGEVLAPDAPDLGIQFTDVRDLGAFCVDFGAERKAGVFNAAGFDGKVTLQELLHGCKIVLGSNCSFTWVDEEFLLQRQVRPFAELPFWLPAPYARHFANEKGLAAGMRFRPIGETILEVADWHFSTRGDDHEWRVYGMRPDREQALLEEWHAAASAEDGEDEQG